MFHTFLRISTMLNDQTFQPFIAILLHKLDAFHLIEMPIQINKFVIQNEFLLSSDEEEIFQI